MKRAKSPRRSDLAPFVVKNASEVCVPEEEGRGVERFPRFFGSSADGSREMLAVIAGSVITVAGVTFSITVAAVAQASAQYTPRILRNFMRDRANQVVLGTFLGIFVYCLVVLRTIRSAQERVRGLRADCSMTSRSVACWRYSRFAWWVSVSLM